MSILEQTGHRFSNLVRERNLFDLEVTLLAKPLTPEEAIGIPGRRDFPIIIGKERIIEATFMNSRGHAFTDSPREFVGTLAEVMELPFTSNQNRAIYIATLNAVLSYLGMVSGTVHCKDDEPEICGKEIARYILEHYGTVSVGLIGLNPAILDHLVQALGADRVRIVDLCRDNIGRQFFGVEVWDGVNRALELIELSDVVLCTGTTLQNGTFDDIWSAIGANNKHGMLFGVTAAGICELSGIKRICPCGREK